MRTRISLLILVLIFTIPFIACSKGSDPVMPSGDIPGMDLSPPDITPPRAPTDGPQAPAEFNTTIELDPVGEPTIGVFTFGDTPMAGIEVRINGELADLTDENGEFEVPAIHEGSHTISFAVLGQVYHSQPYSPVARFAQDSPQPGPGVMTGTVTDENGPVAGALIIVVKGDSYAFTFSGQYGQYHLTGAPAGNCLAIAMAEFHDNAFTAVEIPADGTPFVQDFFLPLNGNIGRIAGRVVSKGIGPVPGAYVLYERPGLFREDLSNIFGIFDLQAIPPGDGHLMCVRDGFYPVDFPLEVHPGLNLVPVILQVIEQSTVHGVVVNAEGETVDGAFVRLQIIQGGGQYPAVYGQLSGPKGYFHFEDLLPGPYVLQAFTPGAIPATELGTILPGTLIEETLVLYPGTGGNAKGWVVDWMGEPIIGAIVQLFYIGSDVKLIAVTGQNGYWELDDIPYGACMVQAQSAAFLPGPSWCDIYPNDPGETITMCFPALDVPTGQLAGTVTDNEGTPLPWSLVWVFNVTDPHKLSHMTFSNEQGEFLFPNIAAGTTAGWALAEGYAPSNEYANIPTDDLAMMDFMLVPE